MLSNCGVGEDSWESLGLQDQTSYSQSCLFRCHLRIKCWLFRSTTSTERRSNQSILKEINPEYLLEGLMLKLKLQYFGHLRWRTNSLERTLMLGKIESRWRRGQRTRWLDSITDSTDMRLSKLWEMVKDREAWRAAIHGVTKSQTWLSDWTTTIVK